ncbi:hypothetical protein LINGRAHAP2_LOCUS5232, partial [Linum grandiflorum]
KPPSIIRSLILQDSWKLPGSLSFRGNSKVEERDKNSSLGPTLADSIKHVLLVKISFMNLEYSGSLVLASMKGRVNWRS